MSFKVKDFLLSCVYFNYCPLVWHSCSYKSLYEFGKIQERALRLLHDDFASDYAKFLKKSVKATMEIKRLQCLPWKYSKLWITWILITWSMKEIFSKPTSLTHRPLDINFDENNTRKYSNNSLQSLRSHIWNSLPGEINQSMLWFISIGVF